MAWLSLCSKFDSEALTEPSFTERQKSICVGAVACSEGDAWLLLQKRNGNIRDRIDAMRSLVIAYMLERTAAKTALPRIAIYLARTIQ